MDEQSPGQGPEQTALKERQKRAEELTRLLNQAAQEGGGSSETGSVDEWLAALEGWATRLHLDDLGQAWLEMADGSMRTRDEDVSFRDKILERLLGPRRDRRLSGSKGLVESPIGDVWWVRARSGPSLLTLGRVHGAYPSLADLGVNPEDLDLSANIVVLQAPRVSDAAMLVGSIFQDPDGVGSEAGALLSPWPMARPRNRRGPTLWVPGAPKDCLRDLNELAAGLNRPVLALEPPLTLSHRALDELVSSGWRIVLGTTPSIERMPQKTPFPNASVFLRFEVQEGEARRFLPLAAPLAA
jgi:hypothetical protein